MLTVGPWRTARPTHGAVSADQQTHEDRNSLCNTLEQDNKPVFLLSVCKFWPFQPMLYFSRQMVISALHFLPCPYGLPVFQQGAVGRWFNKCGDRNILGRVSRCRREQLGVSGRHEEQGSGDSNQLPDHAEHDTCFPHHGEIGAGVVVTRLFQGNDLPGNAPGPIFEFWVPISPRFPRRCPTIPCGSCVCTVYICTASTLFLVRVHGSLLFIA